MIVVKGFPLKNISGITLWPFILVKSKVVSKVLLNHEKIHIRQQVELLILFFYLWYLTEWLYWLFKKRNWWAAYENIVFEKEAYFYKNDSNYLRNRKLWSFLKFYKRHKIT